MTNRKTTKRALLGSVLALVLCFAMLLGSTYAWFTDKEVTGVATMTAGTLDIELTVWNGQTYEAADNYTLFSKTADGDTEILWEPGFALVEMLKVQNFGNLNVKWTAKLVEVADDGTETEVNLAATANGAYDLADVLTVYTSETATTADIATRPNFNDTTVWTGTSLKNFINGLEAGTVDVLAPKGEAGDTATLAIAIKMNEDAGNEYQGLTFDATNYKLVVVATQNTVEIDSYDNTYDDIDIVNGTDASGTTVEFVPVNNGN